MRLGRAFIGIDLSEKYVKELAEPRIEAALKAAEEARRQGRLL